MIYWAKTGQSVTLKAHVQHLLDELNTMLPFRSFVLQRYYERTGRKLDTVLVNSINWHDEGKKDEKWQYHCVNNTLQKAKVRHELVSLVAMRKKNIVASEPVQVAIAAHHGKLGYRHENRWKERPEFEEYNLWNSFLQLGDRVDGIPNAIRKRYEFDGPRSLLQLIDHRASAKEAGDIPANFASFSYTFPFAGKERGVQKLIKDLWDEPFAILRAPTGAGKTDAALLWAQHQIECGRADRLVIAMPTRFTAKSLAISKPEEISTSGLYHSTSRFVHRDISEKDARDLKTADKEQDMARLLESPITVTTLDHLCICLTATREDHHAIFFNLAHSCLVIDEADFYDSFTQQNMVVLLTALRELQVPVLIMSATIPESARQLYSTAGFIDPPIYQDNSDTNRIRCNLTRIGQVTKPDDISTYLEEALSGTPTIIYANTVKRAQEYYRWFKTRSMDFTEKNVICYHSRFTEPDKNRKEELLVSMLGKEAWQASKAFGVAILTQIGELSVNISADLMISDLCPIDRLAQRVGRLSRFHDGCGRFLLVEPGFYDKDGNKHLYPAPYGRWANGWEASNAFIRSNELLTNGEYSAKLFTDLVDRLYPTYDSALPERIRRNRRELENLIEINWLLLPKESILQSEHPEEDSTDRWYSRDIPPQKTLYVGYKPSGINFGNRDDEPSSWSEFRRFQIEHGVQCHMYEFNSAIKSGLLIESRDKAVFTLSRDHTEEIWTVPSTYYDFETGLHLTDESD